MDRCEHCGAPLPDGAKACPSCGKEKAAPPDGTAEKYRKAEFVVEDEDSPAEPAGKAEPSPSAPERPEDRPQAEPAGRAEPQKDETPREGPDAPPRKKHKVSTWIAAAALILLFAFVVFCIAAALNGRNTRGRATGKRGGTAANAKTAAEQTVRWPVEDPSGRFTLSYDGRGQATVTVRDRGSFDDFSLTAVWLGTTKDGGKNVERDPRRYNGTAYWTNADGSSCDVASVIPGGYTKFVYAQRDKGDGSRVIWESEPYYFPASKDPLPLSVTDLTFARWDDGDRLFEAMGALSRAPSYDAAPKVVAIPHSSPALFKASLKDIRYPATLGYRVSFRFDMSSPERGKWLGREIPYAVVLSGPGFTETSGGSTIVYGPDGSGYDGEMYDCMRVFADGRGMQLIYDLPVQLCTYYDEKTFSREYRSGSYTLDLYMAGVKAYTLRFSLQ